MLVQIFASSAWTGVVCTIGAPKTLNRRPTRSPDSSPTPPMMQGSLERAFSIRLLRVTDVFLARASDPPSPSWKPHRSTTSRDRGEFPRGGVHYSGVGRIRREAPALRLAELFVGDTGASAYTESRTPLFVPLPHRRRPPHVDQLAHRRAPACSPAARSILSLDPPIGRWGERISGLCAGGRGVAAIGTSDERAERGGWGSGPVIGVLGRGRGQR